MRHPYRVTPRPTCPEAVQTRSDPSSAAPRNHYVETPVRTWAGDGLDRFLSTLAEHFRGWQGARTCPSLDYDLTISAEHQWGGHVHLTCGIHDRPPFQEGTSRPPPCTPGGERWETSPPRSKPSSRA
ncbi:DUF6228 family protein [Streptomyces sp. NPDC051976]|uniref:DUF6228 family protein n=1 Tax=Streptomyces sp. NPDC051976 TaxID=3154947 RepID=UPI00341C10F2